MSQVTIAENVFDPSTWEIVHDVENINELLSSRWPVFPDTGRIYYKFVAESCDVTPHNDLEIERLENLHGHFFVMIYPKGFELIAVIIAIVLAAVSIGLAFLLRPNTAKPDQSSSPNNALSDRQNQSRPNERIPTIVGTVRGTPDVIQPAFRIFISNAEVEYGYYCVGDGSYKISKADALLGGGTLWDIKDGTTPIQQIDGSSVEVYEPYTSPNSGDRPSLRIGAAIDQKIVNVQKCSSVVGQVLRAPNDQSVTGNNSIRFNSDGSIETSDTNLDFTAYFGAGDDLSVLADSVADPGGHQASVDLSDNYVALSVTSNKIVLASPTTVNSGWTALASFTGAASTYGSPQVAAYGSRWVGAYVLDVADLTEIWANMVCTNGLYKISATSGNQYTQEVDIALGITALDSNYTPIGPEYLYPGTVEGSAILKSQRAVTIKAVLPTRVNGDPAGRVAVRAVRTSLSDTEWSGTNEDQVQWRDLYGISPVTQNDFGDVTTIQTMSYATASALTNNQRQLNMEVTRYIPVRSPLMQNAPDLTFLQPSRNAADITCFLARDQANGNRTDEEIDFAQIYQTLGKAIPATTEILQGNLSDATAQAVALVNGAFVAENAYRISDPIRVCPGETLKINQATGSDPSKGIAFYNAKMQFVDNGPALPYGVNQTFVVPNDAVIMQVTCALADIATLTITRTYQTPTFDGDVISYFGTEECAEFCYTFDDYNTSWEEMISDIGQAVFCQPYRRGSVMGMFFERQVDTAVLLFNNRNKSPGSQTRTDTFGFNSDYDGIEFDYIDPYDPNYPQLETTVTLHFPTDQSAINPRKVKSVGIRNNVQATIIGWRLYQKLLNQHIADEFTATAEASLVINTQPVLSADNTRPETMDGFVVEQQGLVLKLSEPTKFIVGRDYTIFLQLPDGSVQNIDVTPGVDTKHVALAQAPRLPLVIDADGKTYVPTAYTISGPGDTGTEAQMFLVSTKDPQDDLTFDMQLINYSDEYYSHDQDFVNGIVVPRTAASSSNSPFPTIVVPPTGGGPSSGSGGTSNNPDPWSSGPGGVRSA